MVPTGNTELVNGFTVKNRPSKTYRLDIEKERIKGSADDHDAMVQAIYKILRTERYRYLIYSHKYGVELEDLIGEQTSYVKAVLPTRISEALMQDNRITAVQDFEISVTGRNVVTVKFTAVTIFGEESIETEVSY